MKLLTFLFWWNSTVWQDSLQPQWSNYVTIRVAFSIPRSLAWSWIPIRGQRGCGVRFHRLDTFASKCVDSHCRVFAIKVIKVDFRKTQCYLLSQTITFILTEWLLQKSIWPSGNGSSISRRLKAHTKGKLPSYLVQSENRSCTNQYKQDSHITAPLHIFYTNVSLANARLISFQFWNF